MSPAWCKSLTSWLQSYFDEEDEDEPAAQPSPRFGRQPQPLGLSPQQQQRRTPQVGPPGTSPLRSEAAGGLDDTCTLFISSWLESWGPKLLLMPSTKSTVHLVLPSSLVAPSDKGGDRLLDLGAAVSPTNALVSAGRTTSPGSLLGTNELSTGSLVDYGSDED